MSTPHGGTPAEDRDSISAVLAKRCTEAITTVLEKLDAAGIAAPARVVHVVPGREVSWDNGCGQLTARVSSMTPHRSQGRTATLTPCSIDYWTVNVEITMLRCAATISDRGKIPTPERLSVDGLAGLDDMEIMLSALTVLDWVDDVVSWEPQGPEGGNYGNQWVVSTKVDATPCEE